MTSSWVKHVVGHCADNRRTFYVFIAEVPLIFVANNLIIYLVYVPAEEKCWKRLKDTVKCKKHADGETLKCEKKNNASQN